MDSSYTKGTSEEESAYTVHHVLAHSYSFYFLLFIIGIVLDFFYPITIFRDSIWRSVGFLILILASLLILWAQKTSRDLAKTEKKDKEAFCRGPYCYSRSPTHWGLFLLTLGFSIIADAGFVAIFTIIAFVISKLIFLRKEEAILAAKYGTPYLEYKKSVRF